MRKLKWSRYVLTAAVAVGMMVAMAGCGGSSSTDASYGMKNATVTEMASEYDMMGAAYYDDYDYDMEEWNPTSEAINVDESAAQVGKNRKLIRTVEVDVETLEFDKTIATLEEQTTVMGGYIESMDLYNGSRYSYYRNTRNANLTIRIPQDKLEEFLNTVSGISNVVSRSESVEDVTLTYSDLESHKEVLRAEHARLLEFMEQAETIEDMLAIENRLSDIQYQLESMESQLRTYDNKVDYSTVYLSVGEVEELTPTEEEEQTTWERITEGFTDNLFDVLDGLKEFVIWFVIHIPNLIVWAAVIAVIVWIIRSIIKRHKKKKEANVPRQAPGNQNINDKKDDAEKQKDTTQK